MPAKASSSTRFGQQGDGGASCPAGRARAFSAARLRNLVARFVGDRSGSYLIVSGLLMPVLVGVVGVGTEIGLWLRKHQVLQSAADSGAVSAATAYYNQGNAADLAMQANAVTSSYGFNNGSGGVTV